MPLTNFIIAQWNEQVELFTKNLGNLRVRPTKKIVHDIRVNIKKLRSYLDLRKELTGSDWKPRAEKMREFFGVLGKYRDLQMSIGLFAATKNKSIILPSFNRYLRNMLALNKHWLIEVAKDDLILKELSSLSNSFHDDMLPFTNEELDENINELCRRELRSPQLKEEPFKKQPHKNRKNLKTVYYWLTITDNKLLEPVQMKKLEKCLDQLGNWQDHFVLAATLRLFTKQWLIKGTEKYNEAKQLEGSVLKERDRLLNKAIENFQSVKVQ